MGKEPIYRVITFAYCENQIAIRIKLCVSLPKSVLPKSVKAICRFNNETGQKKRWKMYLGFVKWNLVILCEPIRVVDVKSVDVLRVRIWYIKLGSGAVWNAYFPQGRAISWWIIHNITEINHISWTTVKTVKLNNTTFVHSRKYFCMLLQNNLFTYK